MNASKPAASASRLRWEVLEASANKGAVPRKTTSSLRCTSQQPFVEIPGVLKCQLGKKGKNKCLHFFDGEADLMSAFI